MDEASLHGRRILVIEDDFLVAQVLMDILMAAGAEVLGPIGWANEAIAFVNDESAAFDGVVLDINLHGTKSYQIADALAARSIGFVFASGYGAEAVEKPYQCYPRCQKPFNADALIATLAAV